MSRSALPISPRLSPFHMNTPMHQTAEEQETAAFTDQFHAFGTFAALWMLVLFSGIDQLSKAKDILEPLLWAFFLMMGLVPLSEVIERNLMKCGICCHSRKGKKSRSGLPSARRERKESKESSASAGGSASTLEIPEVGRGFQYKELEAQNPVETKDSDEESEEEEEAPNDRRRWGLARPTAIIIVILGTIFTCALFFTMVYRSAQHMQSNWHHFENGSQNVTLRVQGMLKYLPEGMVEKLTGKETGEGTVEKLTGKALHAMESALGTILSTILEATTHTAVEMLWILLYMIFWLCQPFHVGKEVSNVFRRYIFLKGIASSGYAFCVWVLLHCIGVDLAIVFGLITFVLNFIPEIGPFIAMILPLPVILFDDRVADPIEFMFLAWAGQMGLKVVFGNIIEIKLIESQQEMRMHPVIILFFVAFFQYVWGATGMLLSVPIVAAMKATLHKIPPSYRDRALIFLEGDKNAPARWAKWHDKMERELKKANAISPL